MRRILISFVLLIAVLLACDLALAGNTVAYPYSLGDSIEDFTVTTYDGRTLTLSEILQEKDAVLINIWATWCPPCRAEFPYMEEAYQQYKDKVEIIALSCESTDTDEVLADFAASMGLTFPIARDTPNLAYKFNASSIPTTIMVDRFGTICFLHAGSQPSTERFTHLFDAFIGDWYTASTLYSTIPSAKPDLAHADPDALAEALNAENGTLTFMNPTHPYHWPMSVAEEDGRSCVVSTNTGVNSSTALIATTVTPQPGDVLAFDFKLSAEPIFDGLQLIVDDQAVKVFSGEKDWQSFAWRFENGGETSISLAYVKDHIDAQGLDRVWIDNVRLLTGDAAEEALSGNPVYPLAEATSLLPVQGREIIINDPSGIFEANFPGARYYIAVSEEVRLTMTLAEGFDPESAAFYASSSGYHLLADLTDGEAYAVSIPLNTQEFTGIPYTVACLYPAFSGHDPVIAVFFPDEAHADAFMAYADGASYAYAQNETPDEPALPATAVYAVTVLDQHGAPVPGVMVQICDDTLCQVLRTDENGKASVELPPYAYEIHLLKLPAGYTGDTTTVTAVPVLGSELTFTITKE